MQPSHSVKTVKTMYQSETNYMPSNYKQQHEESYSNKAPREMDLQSENLKQDDTASQGIAWISKKPDEDQKSQGSTTIPWLSQK